MARWSRTSVEQKHMKKQEEERISNCIVHNSIEYLDSFSNAILKQNLAVIAD